MEQGDKARVPPPPRPRQSLLSNALGGGGGGGGSSTAGGGSRGSALVSGVQAKLAASSNLLDEAMALSSNTHSRPMAQWRDTPENTAIPCGDPRIGGVWRQCCTLPCCSTLSSAVKRNAHGSPEQSDDEESDGTPHARTAHTSKTARAGTLDFLHNTAQGKDLARAMGRGAGAGRGAEGAGSGRGGGRGAGMSGGRGAGSRGAGDVGGISRFFEPSGRGGGGSGGRGGGSGGSGGGGSSGGIAAATAPPLQAEHRHHYVWAAELAHELQAEAVHLSFREKHELAKIAQANHTLIKRGSFEVARQGFRLDTNGLPNHTHRLSAPAGGQPLVPPTGETALCVANIDTASCLRALQARGVNPCALNFANAFHAGGGYVHGARAQEEDLCRLMPPLFGQLKRLRYPLGENEAHYTHTLLARQAGTYELLAPPLRVAIVSGAMPNLGSAKGARRGERQLQPGTEQWRRTVELRCRTVVDAAVANGHDALILGAFGCGAFGNPPADVAAVFARVLGRAEFRGKLQLIVFAIVDPKAADVGNLVTFRDVLKRELCNE